MKKEERYFAKSFEEDFVLKTLKGKKKVSFQSIQNILDKNIIRLNTKSFGNKPRLACTLLHKNYLKTYRSQGIIFQTKDMPEVVYPFDMVLLTNAKKIIVQYYRIKENLHEYYNFDLIKGFKKFMFKDFNKMLKEFSSPKIAWKKISAFRKKAGFGELPKQKYKLVEYNEVIFNKFVKIKPIAIYGYTQMSREIAKKYNLPYFRNVKEFYKKC